MFQFRHSPDKVKFLRMIIVLIQIKLQLKTHLRSQGRHFKEQIKILNQTIAM